MIRFKQFITEGGGQNMFLPATHNKSIEVNTAPRKENRDGYVSSGPVGVEHADSIHSSLQEFSRRFKEKTGGKELFGPEIKYGGSTGPIMDKSIPQERKERWGKTQFNDIDTHATEDSGNKLHNLFKNDGKDNKFGNLTLKAMTSHGGGRVTSVLFHHEPSGAHIQVDLLHTPKGPKGELFDPAHIDANASHPEDLDHNIKGAHRNAFLESIVSTVGPQHRGAIEVSKKTGKPVKNDDASRGSVPTHSLSAGRVGIKYRNHDTIPNAVLQTTPEERAKEGLPRSHEWLTGHLKENVPESVSFVQMHKILRTAVKSGKVTSDQYKTIKDRYNAKIKARGGLREGVMEELDKKHAS
jgi:hypothetical protein